MDKLITINLSYYNQSKEVLLKHIKAWKSYDEEVKKLFTFFIIDDGSKIPCANLLKDVDLTDIDVHLYQADVDLVCNIAGVMNLGAKECKTPWMVILDMDTLVSAKMAKELISLAKQHMDQNVCFRFNRIVVNDPKHIKNEKPHPKVCLIRLKDYWNIGGYEEDLVGSYGMSDPCFWYRAKGKVTEIVKMDIYLEYYVEGESKINRNTRRNKKIYCEKIKNNSWSTDFVRFPWHKVF